MEGIVVSSSSASVSQEASSHNTHGPFAQQSLFFADSLTDLKNLRKQLYSAAEYFELSYRKDYHKQLVLDTLRDYAIKAFVHTVDLLGFISNKVNRFLDEKVGEVLRSELQFSCNEQLADAEIKYAAGQEFPNDPKGSLCADNYLPRSKNANPGTTTEIPTRKGYSTLPSRQYSNSRTFYFEGTKPNKQLERRTTPPSLFRLKRSKSLVSRSTVLNSLTTAEEWSSEPRRSVSLCTCAEGERRKKTNHTPTRASIFLKRYLACTTQGKNIVLNRNPDRNPEED
ncbi:protein ABIL3-like [Malania oleifera]|uniref:protein ABIL3-like n=1 Tax=Malania oleifera TaxID=397392 RepID=UPI0025AE891C|nr:protein ABIL3-like [Malania oleifera]